MLYQHHPAQCGSPGLTKWDIEVLDFVDRASSTSTTIGHPGDGKPGQPVGRYMQLVEKSFESLISDAESYLAFPVSRKGIDQQYLLRDACNIAITSEDIDHLVRRAKMLHQYVTSIQSLTSMKRILPKELPSIPLDPLGSDPVTMPCAGAVRLYVASCYQLRHLLRYRIADLIGSHDHQQRKCLEEWEKSDRKSVAFDPVADARLSKIENAIGIEPPAVDDKDDLDSLRRRYFEKLNAIRNPQGNQEPVATDPSADSPPSTPSKINDNEIADLEKRSGYLLSSLTKLREMLDQWDRLLSVLRWDAYLSTDGHIYRKQFKPPAEGSQG